MQVADPTKILRGVDAISAWKKASETAQAAESGTQINKQARLQEVFKDTRVKDTSGLPRKVFTGTSKDTDFTAFKVPRNGTWFSENADEASQYAMENDSMTSRQIPGTWKFEDVNTSSRVLPVYLDIRNPKEFKDPKEFNDLIFKYGKENYKKGQGQLFDILRSQGYDGVVLGDKEGERVWVVLGKPNQIKSAIGNTGKYDLTKPSMIATGTGAAILTGTPIGAKKEEVQ